MTDTSKPKSNDCNRGMFIGNKIAILSNMIRQSRFFPADPELVVPKFHPVFYFFRGTSTERTVFFYFFSLPYSGATINLLLLLPVQRWERRKDQILVLSCLSVFFFLSSSSVEFLKFMLCEAITIVRQMDL